MFHPIASDIRKTVIAITLLTAFLCYSFFLYAKLPMQHHFLTPQADRGKQLWQELNCGACHQIYGLGGYLGPDLTNVYSLRGPDYIKSFLTNGTPSMPAFHLSDEESLSLLAYLQHIDSTGVSDPRSFIIYYDGTIEQK
jgi:nitric oxide reductase subunit C